MVRWVKRQDLKIVSNNNKPSEGGIFLWFSVVVFTFTSLCGSGFQAFLITIRIEKEFSWNLCILEQKCKTPNAIRTSKRKQECFRNTRKSVCARYGATTFHFIWLTFWTNYTGMGRNACAPSGFNAMSVSMDHLMEGYSVCQSDLWSQGPSILHICSPYPWWHG